MPDEIIDIPTKHLSEPWVVLRLVNRESANLKLRDSIADKGLLNSICV